MDFSYELQWLPKWEVTMWALFRFVEWIGSSTSRALWLMESSRSTAAQTEVSA